MAQTFLRFFKYSSIGVSTFLFDLLLLYVLADIFHVNYLIATGVAFLIAVSINFYFSRRFVFKESEQKPIRGYSNFLIIAGTGLLFIELLMILSVEILGFHYLPSRIVVAGIIGMWNYLMNLFVNFKVAGKH